MKKISIAQVRDAARRYQSVADAASALGISATAFRRTCREHDIKWKKGKQWGEGSRRYRNICSTPKCERYPSSASGKCFSCYAAEARENVCV